MTGGRGTFVPVPVGTFVRPVPSRPSAYPRGLPMDGMDALRHRHDALLLLHTSDLLGFVAWLETPQHRTLVQAEWFRASLAAGNDAFARAAWAAIPDLRFSRERDLSSLFCEAAKSPCSKLVEELAEQCEVENRWATEVDSCRRAPLLLACLAGQSVNTMLIAQYAGAWGACRTCEASPWLPVHAAASLPDGSCMLALLECWSELTGRLDVLLDAKTHYEQVPVMIATRYGTPTLEFLLQEDYADAWPRWARVRDSEGGSWLSYAEEVGCTRVVKLLHRG